MVKDTYTGPSSTSSSSYGPAHLTAVGNTLFFQVMIQQMDVLFGKVMELLLVL